jgi:hypothetical protein
MSLFVRMRSAVRSNSVKNVWGTASVARFGLLALATALAGCGGAASTPALTAMQSVPSAVQDAGKHRCMRYNFGHFNKLPISAGSWIWFTSVFTVPGPPQTVRFLMGQSQIRFYANSQWYTVDVPSARISLHSQSNLHINYAQHNGAWWLMAPYGTKGNVFMDAVAYQVPTSLSGGIKPVIWRATFESAKGFAYTHVKWRWGAAVYTNFTDAYNSLGVKPLDDRKYPPYNSDPPGTPENYKQYVTPGGTGFGRYTGDLGGTVNVLTCGPK